MTASSRFSGQTVIVTGGAAGIGLSVAQAFYAGGANVVVADIKNAAEIAAQIDPSGHRVLGLDVDVASDAAVDAAVAATLGRFSRLDALVNNAGIATGIVPRPFGEITSEEWLRVYDVNVVGIFRFSRAASRAMASTGGGRIVNMASAAAFKGVPLLLHYVSSKGAVLAMTKSMARELGEMNILVNAVAPGFTISPAVKENQGQMQRSREISLQGRTIKRDQFPDDLVGAVLFFASPDSAFITGQTLVVDGGTYMH